MKATVNSIYKAACRLIFETPDDDEDLKASFPVFLSMALLHALDTENNIRAVQARAALPADDVPDVESADDTATELPFDARILRLAVPYAIKSSFLADDNSKKAESVIAWNQFVEELGRIAPAAFVDVPAWGAED